MQVSLPLAKSLSHTSINFQFTKVYSLFALALVTIGISLFTWQAVTSPQRSTTNAATFPIPSSIDSLFQYTITNDTNLGHITIENSIIKAVFHYKTIAQENYHQGGGDLYELYDKISSSGQNLIDNWTSGGTQNTNPLGVGAGGVGSTEMYTWNAPKTDNLAKDPSFKPNWTYDYIADTIPDTSSSSPKTLVDANGNAIIVFTYTVARRNPADPTNQSKWIKWYTITKTWTLGPSGSIALRQDWHMLRSGWVSEVASRNQWSMDAGYQTLQKYGHDWDPQVSGCDRGSGITFNGNTCRTNHWVTINLVPVTNGCFSSTDRLLTQKVLLEGAHIAPDIAITVDNSGNGLENGGLWTLNRTLTNGTATDTTFEECSYNLRTSGQGDAAFPLGFYSWWGGNPPTADRYRYVDTSVISSWTDTYRIDLNRHLPQ